MRCVNCGNEIPGKMRFCPVCGTPADAKAPYEDSYDDGYGERYDPGYDDRMESDGIHVCGNCGSPLEYGDAFCCVCGTPVHWDDSGEGTDVNPGSAEPEKWRPAEDMMRKRNEFLPQEILLREGHPQSIQGSAPNRQN